MAMVASATATTMVGLTPLADRSPPIAAMMPVTEPVSAAMGMPWAIATTPRVELVSAATAAITAVANSAMPIAVGASACAPPTRRSMPKRVDWTMARKPQNTPATTPLASVAPGAERSVVSDVDDAMIREKPQ